MRFKLGFAPLFALFFCWLQPSVAQHPANSNPFYAQMRNLMPGGEGGANYYPVARESFFNEYVYGTELPAYHFEGQATDNDKGTSIQIKITQSGVSPQFKMLVPVYLELGNGHTTRLGTVNIVGSSTLEKTVQLPKLGAPVKRVLINYNYDVLCTDK